MYIADARERTGEITIAGKVIAKREKKTKSDKPFFILDFSDGTGRMSGTVFCTKEILRKMEKVQEGSEVIVFGEAQTVDGFHRYTIKSINLCEFPKDFKYEERASRKPPESYLVVHPGEVEGLAKQTDLFTLGEKTPECLIGKSIVVLDIETTGTAFTDDKITEIGAVKVIDGEIIEKFSTLVNPERKIPENIVELTGINDEMVANAPTFNEVAGDLYKFCYGSIIVAHNLNFDYTFIKNQSKKCDYVYSNRGIDTLTVAREVLPTLSNHKLNTVCEHFGIEFLHHRAYNDALATAQMLIELIKIKGSMPEFDV
jgi:DNA polymerase III epsilon subunit family exonuclease